MDADQHAGLRAAIIAEPEKIVADLEALPDRLGVRQAVGDGQVRLVGVVHEPHEDVGHLGRQGQRHAAVLADERQQRHGHGPFLRRHRAAVSQAVADHHGLFRGQVDERIGHGTPEPVRWLGGDKDDPHGAVLRALVLGHVGQPAEAVGLEPVGHADGELRAVELFVEGDLPGPVGAFAGLGRGDLRRVGQVAEGSAGQLVGDPDAADHRGVRIVRPAGVEPVGQIDQADDPTGRPVDRDLQGAVAQDPLGFILRQCHF